MKVLCQGPAFYVGQTPLHRYTGPHEIRTICAHREFYQTTFDYSYDLEKDSVQDVLARIGKEWKPDLFLFWSPEDQSPPRGIEDCPIPPVAVTSDWYHVYPRIYVNLARFDVAVCDLPGVDALTTDLLRPRYWGPIYSHNTTLHRPHAVEKDLDVVYVGGFNHVIRPERGRYLARLARLSDRYRILLAEGYYGEDYARLLSRAKIVFNHAIRGELNLRVFETMACGGVPFLEEGNREAAAWLEDGRDVVLYNEHNFKERLTYYLEHPEAAAAIVANCRARAQEFAGENRLTDFIEWAAAQASGGRLFRTLPPRERAYQDVLLHSGSWLEAVRRRERELIHRFASEAADDPRAWSALGSHLANPFLNPYLTGHHEEGSKEPCRKALVRAHKLAPASAPHAMNAAAACAWAGDTEGEARYLAAVLAADTIEGAELLLGNVQDPFWTPWMFAVAQRRAHLGMIHAEAHVRLAMIAIQARRYTAAEDHLAKALTLEPEHPAGVRLLGELCWAGGRRDEAVAHLQAHLARVPFDDACRKRLEEMLRLLGQLEAAEVLAREARQLREVCRTNAN